MKMVKFDLDPSRTDAVIKIMGVGGGGCNAVAHMARNNIVGVELIAVNTDGQVLESLKKQNLPIEIVRIGEKTTANMGAGGDPKIGESAACESEEQLKEVMAGADMLFVTSGLGGGTGTGATPIIARIAQELKTLAICVVTKPFNYEGKRRMKLAEECIDSLNDLVNSIIVIPNQKLCENSGEKLTMRNAFAKADNILLEAVRGISDVIKKPGYINLDFADVRTVLSTKGRAVMGTGMGSGDNLVRNALAEAIKNPLLDGADLHQGRNILINLTVNPDICLSKINEIHQIIRNEIEPQCRQGNKISYINKAFDKNAGGYTEADHSMEPEVFPGIVFDDKLGESECKMTVIVAGMTGLAGGAQGVDGMRSSIEISSSQNKTIRSSLQNVPDNGSRVRAKNAPAFAPGSPRTAFGRSQAD